MKYTISNANEYIQKAKEGVNRQYRLKFHMMPPVGWMNDPNGCVKFQDTYHIFGQYYPYETQWGPMHWAHFSSKDLVKYTDEPVALAPENQDMESGCWSGGAIATEDALALIYTRHYEANGEKRQTQYMATSQDGIHFVKNEKCLFDNDLLPANVVKNDFRDPYPVYKNGNYYLLVGGKLDTNEGVLLVLKSDRLGDFKYDFMIEPIYEFGDMGECPAYYNVDGMDIIVASGCRVQEAGNSFKNENSSFYIAGNIDFENKCMQIVKVAELDKGDTFYAPQIINSCDKPIMTAWMEMWGKEYPTAKLGHNWTGAFILPRKLSWKDNTLYQEPVDAIENYYGRTYEHQEGAVSRISDITIEAEQEFNVDFVSVNGKFSVGQDAAGVYLNTCGANNLNECIRHTDAYYKNAKIRILLDTSSVELFVDDGRETITSRVYLDSDYSLVKSGNISKITIHEIEV